MQSISLAPSPTASSASSLTRSRSSSPSRKFTTVAMRTGEPRRRSRARTTSCGQTQTAATGPCGVSACRQSASRAGSEQVADRSVRSRQRRMRRAISASDIVDPRDEGPDQAPEAGAGAGGLLLRLGMRGRRAGNAGRHVGDDRERRDLEAEITRQDHLRHRRHADAFVEADAGRGRGKLQLLAQALVIGPGEVDEAGVAAVAEERVRAREVDVVGDRDEARGAQIELDRAGGVGEEERRRPERRDDAERNLHGRRVAGLVVMRPALKQEDALALDSPGDETARVSGDGGQREMRRLGIGDADRVLEIVGEVAEPGAEHHGAVEAAVEAAAAQERGGFGDVGVRGRGSVVHEATKLSGPKAKGNKASREKLRRSPSGPAAWISVSGPANSRMRWRQAPQGVTRAAPSPRTRIAAIRRPPAATIAAIAAASAQVPTG